MSSVCASTMPAGINKGCLKFPAPISNIIISTDAVTFAGLTEFLNYDEWRQAIQEDLTAFVPAQITSYEDTTNEPTINETQKGSKIFLRKGVPSMNLMLRSNNCDFNELQSTLRGSTYYVYFILEDSSIVGWINDTGTIKGFSASITAGGSGIPSPDAVENSFPVYVLFDYITEFERRIIQDPVWTPEPDMQDAMPLGITLIKDGVYATGDQDVYIEERCGDVVTGLTTADFEVTGSNNLDTPAVTAVVDNGSGSYTLTVEKGAVPASLDPGDYVTLRVKTVTGSIVDSLSGQITVYGV